VVEMVLKVVAYGFHNYWRSDQNRFDFVITVTVGESNQIQSPVKVGFRSLHSNS
jgi:hypothetical protein